MAAYPRVILLTDIAAVFGFCLFNRLICTLKNHLVELKLIYHISTKPFISKKYAKSGAVACGS